MREPIHTDTANLALFAVLATVVIFVLAASLGLEFRDVTHIFHR